MINSGDVLSSTDGFIQVPVDAGGKRVDTTEITRTDFNATIVERQRFEAHDGNDDILSTADVVKTLKTTNDLLFQMLDVLDDIRSALVFNGVK